ncbi:MAG TPA: DUF6790 family protein, partial [Xanthobacteraceae bacterium]|nr:DUF6790 family protein [Xanthobacteraceae bacterium]
VDYGGAAPAALLQRLNGSSFYMIRDVIAFVIANYFVTFFIIGIVVALIEIVRLPSPRPPGAAVDALLANYCLFPIGLSYLVNFVFHVFFGEMAAKFIGWANSPFQLEVGFASLGFGLVGLLAWRGSYGLRVGAVVGPAMFMLGAAGGHIYQMIAAHNFSPGNVGLVLPADIITPLFGLALLWLARPQRPA